MINKVVERLKDAFSVLVSKRYVLKIKKPPSEFTWSKTFTKKEIDYLRSITIEFIFAEIGEERQNAGGVQFDAEHRLNPAYDSLLKIFPQAKITVYTDFDLKLEGVNIKRIESPLKDKSHPRFGHRSSVYFRFMGLLQSKADFKCSLDTDMLATSTDLIALVRLTEKFGFCVPHNDRQLLRQDAKISLDSKPITDESRGMGRSYNQSPMTLWRDDTRGKEYYKKASDLMLKNPARGSYIMWKAAWETGLHPYVLPIQFCVCTGNEGIGDEALLHVGHPSVASYYKYKL